MFVCCFVSLNRISYPFSTAWHRHSLLTHTASHTACTRISQISDLCFPARSLGTTALWKVVCPRGTRPRPLPCYQWNMAQVIIPEALSHTISRGMKIGGETGFFSAHNRHVAKTQPAVMHVAGSTWSISAAGQQRGVSAEALPVPWPATAPSISTRSHTANDQMTASTRNPSTACLSLCCPYATGLYSGFGFSRLTCSRRMTRMARWDHCDVQTPGVDRPHL